MLCIRLVEGKLCNKETNGGLYCDDHIGETQKGGTVLRRKHAFSCRRRIADPKARNIVKRRGSDGFKSNK